MTWLQRERTHAGKEERPKEQTELLLGPGDDVVYFAVGDIITPVATADMPIWWSVVALALLTAIVWYVR